MTSSLLGNCIGEQKN